MADPAPPGPPAPGGGPGAAPVPVAYIAKEAGEISIIKENTAEVSVTVKITDSGDRGIGNVTPMIYTPRDSEFNAYSLSIRIYDKSKKSWKSYN